VRLLESKGFLSYKDYVKTYEYFPIISKEEYGQRSFRKVFANYFDNSVENLLSFMAKQENLTEVEIEKLKKLIPPRF
jgi:predicted transcriptional regulator